MQEILTKFISWTKLKMRLHLREDKNIYFYEREIWWASLGINIGYEQDGKNDKFERPILVLRKFGGKTLWALPLTSKEKTDVFHYQLIFENEKSWVILSQLRLISSKRLLRKIRLLSDVDFEKIRKCIKDLI